MAAGPAGLFTKIRADSLVDSALLDVSYIISYALRPFAVCVMWQQVLLAYLQTLELVCKLFS